MEKTINIGSTRKPLFAKYDTDNIKDRCFICGVDIIRGKEDREIYYEKYGNCCHKCNARASEVVSICSAIDRLRNKISSIKSGKLSKDMKDFTEEEIQARLKLCEKDLKSELSDLAQIEPTHPYL